MEKINWRKSIREGLKNEEKEKSKKAEEFAINSMKIFYEKEDGGNYDWVRENTPEFYKFLKDNDPELKAEISIENADREGWKIVKTNSWRKAFSLGLIPGKSEEIPEFILDENGDMTETLNPFFGNIEKINK